jgi:hypothetical protein
VAWEVAVVEATERPEMVVEEHSSDWLVDKTSAVKVGRLSLLSSQMTAGVKEAVAV